MGISTKVSMFLDRAARSPRLVARAGGCSVSKQTDALLGLVALEVVDDAGELGEYFALREREKGLLPGVVERDDQILDLERARQAKPGRSAALRVARIRHEKLAIPHHPSTGHQPCGP